MIAVVIVNVIVIDIVIAIVLFPTKTSREGAGVVMWTGLGDSSDIMGELQNALHDDTRI